MTATYLLIYSILILIHIIIVIILLLDVSESESEKDEEFTAEIEISDNQEPVQESRQTTPKISSSSIPWEVL